MAEPDPFLAAVRAVPHRGDCSAGWTINGVLSPKGPCDCDRDERIARGLKAMHDYFQENLGYIESYQDYGETATIQGLHAFTETARG